jgi:glycine cleavage system H lipoate-binding protein
MRCPFLREAQVKYCRAFAFRKMIVRTPGQVENERCLSPEYIHCPAARQHQEERPDLTHCPFLHESLAQYCAAAPLTKYIPYSEPVMTPCGTDKHNYCQLYLSVANPKQGKMDQPENPGNTEFDSHTKEHLVGGLRMRDWLFYSPNHMWLDVSQDGFAYIGIDSFLTSVLGKVDRISFVTTKGICRPTLVFTVNGVDLQMVFPKEIQVTNPNLYLRTSPSKIFSDPYTLGWLFEGREVPEGTALQTSSVRNGLKTGASSVTWMRSEVDRLSQVAHRISHQPDPHGVQRMADGGTSCYGLIRNLNREESLQLFHEFFSPLASWR